MKRDMELIRKILQALEANDKPGPIEGFSDEQIDYHMRLLEDAGLITQYEFFPASAGSLLIGVRLTWDGHEFNDAAKSDSVWQKAKSMVVTKTGALSFDLLKMVLAELSKRALMQAIGS